MLQMSNEKMDTEREISSLKALARTSDKLEPLSDFDEAMIGKLVERIEVINKKRIKIIFKSSSETEVDVV